MSKENKDSKIKKLERIARQGVAEGVAEAMGKVNIGEGFANMDSWDLFKKERKKGLKLAGDEKTFNEAFKFIRDNYGSNAIFVWRGKKYNTKHKGEK